MFITFSLFLFLFLLAKFLLDIFYLHIKFYPLSKFPVQKPSYPNSPPPSSMRVFPHPTHPFPPPHFDITLCWGYKYWQDKGLHLPFVSVKSIICYIRTYSHVSAHVYSLGLGLVQVILFVWHSCYYGVASHFSSFNPMRTSFSVQWLSAIICLYICHALIEPLSRQLYKASISMYFLDSAILSRFTAASENLIEKTGNLPALPI